MKFRTEIFPIIINIIFLVTTAFADDCSGSIKEILKSTDFSIVGRHTYADELLENAKSLNDWLPDSLRLNKLLILDGDKSEDLVEGSLGLLSSSYQYIDINVDYHFMRSLLLKDFSGLIQIPASTFRSTKLERAIIFTHEFGHAIFDLHYKATIGFERVSKFDLLQDYNNFVKNNEEYRTLVSELSQSSSMTAEEVKIKVSALKRLITSNPDLKKIRSKLIMLTADSSKTIAHQEFLSDLLPVLHFNNPNIMVEVIASINTTIKEIEGSSVVGLDALQRRTFSELHSLKGWRDINGPSRNIYTRYTHTRGMLMRLLKRKKVTSSQYPKVILAVFNAIQTHVDEIKKFELENPSQFSNNPRYFGYREELGFTQANRDFLRHIVHELEALDVF